MAVIESHSLRQCSYLISITYTFLQGALRGNKPAGAPNSVGFAKTERTMFVMAKVRDVVEETPVCGITIYKSGCQLSGRTVGLHRKKDWEPVHEALPGCQRPAKASKIRIIERNNNRARLLEPICHGIHERSGASVGVRLTSDFPALPCEHRRNPRRAAHV